MYFIKWSYWFEFISYYNIWIIFLYIRNTFYKIGDIDLNYFLNILEIHFIKMELLIWIYLFHIIIYELFFYIRNTFYKIGDIDLNCIIIYKLFFKYIRNTFYKIGDIDSNCIIIYKLFFYHSVNIIYSKYIL